MTRSTTNGEISLMPKLQHDDQHGEIYVEIKESNKIARTVIVGILYFLFGAFVCLSIFGLGIAFLMS